VPLPGTPANWTYNTPSIGIEHEGWVDAVKLTRV
jgi:hypothetical protein